MSNKACCPGCDSYLSAIWEIMHGERWEPCPKCGLPAETLIKIQQARESHASKELAEKYEALAIRCGRAEAEAAYLRSQLCRIRSAVDGTPDHWHDEIEIPNWRGDAYLIRLPEGCSKAAAASVIFYATQLGMCGEVAGDTTVKLTTGQPELYAKADQVAAYAAGITVGAAEQWAAGVTRPPQ